MALAEIVLKLTLVIFMLGNLLDMGLRLRLSEALRDLRDVRFVIWSVLWGFVILPAFAYAIARLIPMAHAYAVGLVLLGMTPCAPFLPPMVDRAHGDLAYTAAFMLLANVVTVLYMPLAVPVLVKGFSANAFTIAKPLVLFLLVPLAIGLAIKHRSDHLAGRLEPVIKKVTGIDTVLMLFLCLVIYGKDFLGLAGSYAIGAQILFFAVATAAPNLLSFGIPNGQRVVISLGMATRNLGAAFAPLFALRGVDQRSIVMVALGVIMQATFAFGAASYYGRGRQTARGSSASG